jgi:hypothetical protein
MTSALVFGGAAIPRPHHQGRPFDTSPARSAPQVSTRVNTAEREAPVDFLAAPAVSAVVERLSCARSDARRCDLTASNAGKDAPMQRQS